MIIKIDVRETELLAKCRQLVENVHKFKDIKIVSEQLPLGDIIINDGINDCVVIERKTIKDLSASIKDGRYEEQSYRLNNALNMHNHNIMYLIEGDVNAYNSFKDRIDKLTIYSSLFSISYFKGFSVIRTMNLEETSTFICNSVCKLVNGLKLGKTGYYSNIDKIVSNNLNGNNLNGNNLNGNNLNGNDAVVIDKIDDKLNGDNVVEEKQYSSVVKQVKKNNVTVNNIGEIMLCQIPGISSTTAIAILSKFNNIATLVECIQNDENCLQGITTTDSNGKSRKISKTVISTIIEYLKK